MAVTHVGENLDRIIHDENEAFLRREAILDRIVKHHIALTAIVERDRAGDFEVGKLRDEAIEEFVKAHAMYKQAELISRAVFGDPKAIEER